MRMSEYSRYKPVPVEVPVPAEASPLAKAALLGVDDGSSGAGDSPSSEASSTAKTSPLVKTRSPWETSHPAKTSRRAKTPSPAKTPRSANRTAMIALKDHFKEATDLEVLSHCMGLKRSQNIPTIVGNLADYIILICIDCEHWSNNTDEATEVGIATFSRQDFLPLVAKGDFGDHGEHLMQQVKFYLLRLTETSHLPNQNPNSRGVEGNRFGQGRFVTFSEARQIMYNLFVQPIKDVDGLRGGNCPIVVLGHDVTHDKNNLKNKATAFDMDPVGTVVRYIDTQALVREVMYWLVPRNEQIGLKRLVEELWFEHSDPHTAANDAGRTLISAFQMALRENSCTIKAGKSMWQVATDLEEHSVANFKSIGGVEKYCWKCGDIGHMKRECTATGLRCDECEKNGCDILPGEEHITAHCLCIANKKAEERRVRDARARSVRGGNRNHTPSPGNRINPPGHGQTIAPGEPDRKPVRYTSTQHRGRSLGRNSYTGSQGGHPYNHTYRGEYSRGSFRRGSDGYSSRRGGRGGGF